MYRAATSPSAAPARARPPLATLVRWLLTAVLTTVAMALMIALLSSARLPQAGTVRGFVFGAQPADAPLADAAERLSRQWEQDGPSTSLTPDEPYAIRVEIDVADAGTHLLELRHLRARHARFELLEPAPAAAAASANPAAADGLAWRHEKGGVVVRLPETPAGRVVVLGHVEPAYPGVLKAFVWTPATYRSGTNAYYRVGGVLMGACVVIALTMGLLAWRNRDLIAALFGLSVLLMLRVAAINNGWDAYWLGYEFDSPLHSVMLRMTLPLYAVAQTALFQILFKRELSGIAGARPLPWAIGAFAMLAAASPWMPHEAFLRVFWTMLPAGALYLIYLLVRLIPRTRDRAARLYTAAVVVTVTGTLGDVLFATGWWTTTLSASLMGAVTSSVLFASAIAERIYADRRAAQEAQVREITALRDKEETFQSMPMALFEFSSDGVLRHCNNAFRALFSPAVTVALGYSRLDDFFRADAGMIAEDTKGETRTLEALALPGARDAAARYAEVHWKTVDGRVQGSAMDATDRVNARLALQRLVDHDQLTGVLNVRGLQSRFDAQRARDEDDHCIALIDLVRFDSVNELFGRKAGDHVLTTIAARLQDAVGEAAFLARLGADTFLVLLPGSDVDAAAYEAQRISQACVMQPVDYDHKAIPVSVCIGVVAITPEMSLEEAIGASQRALARAKRQRTGAVSIAKDKADALSDYLTEKALVGKLTGRLDREHLYQVMQPIIDLRNPGGAFCAEALIRMRVNGEEISAARFIPAAERNGLMSEIDRWTLEQSCIWLTEHRARLEALDYLTINVSGASLNDLQFHSSVQSLLAEYAAVAPMLCFEITESVALTEPQWTNRFTEMLRSRGSRVALDDFGAGYSSFDYLRSIPAQILKVDGAIVQTIATDPSSLAILRAIRDLTADLGMRCVAEFAFDYATVRALRELDVDFGQGYALARPGAPALLLDAPGGLALVQDPEVARYLASTAGMKFTTSERHAHAPVRAAAPAVGGEPSGAPRDRSVT